MKQAFTSSIIAMLITSACAATEIKTEVPALIVNPDKESLAEISEIVSEALNGVSVTLADDVLTKNSILTIEPKRLRNMQNNPVMGRDLGNPIRFQLYKSGNHCKLKLESSNKSWILKFSTCTEE